MSPRNRRTTPTAAAPIAASAKKNPTRPVSLRNCSGTLWGSVTTMSFVRSSRCVSSNVPAPVPRHGCFSHACHASFHQSQRLDELAFARCCGPPWSDAFVGWEVNSRNQPCGFASTVRATSPTATPATSTPRATRPMSRRRASERGRRSSASEPRYASAPTATAASTNTTANQAPSCARTACDCPSSASPGRENAHTATPRPAPPPSKIAAALSTRGDPRTSHSTTATPAASTPPRE